MWKILRALILAVLVFGVWYLGLKDSIITVSANEKIKVVDGDSLEIGSRRIRLQGIDSPEYVQNCYDKHHKKYSCGIKAKKYMEKLIAQGNIECREDSKDRYGRSLSTCYSGTQNLNEAMVRAGWAVAYRDEDGIYNRAEQAAKEQKLGIWQGKFMRPELFRFKNRQSNS